MNSIKSAAFCFALAAPAFLAFAPAANADTDYSFNSVFTSGSQTETLTGQLIVSGNQIVGFTGSLDGLGFTGPESFLNGVQGITAFLDNPNFPGTDSIRVDGGTDLIFDNVFNAASTSLDGSGIVFQLSNGQDVNLWGDGGNAYELFIGNYLFDGRGDATIDAPEPASWALMLTGLLAFAGLLFARRQRKTPDAFAAA